MVKYYIGEDVTGKEVIELEAKKVGVVKDLAFTLAGKVAFVVETENKNGELKENFLAFEKIINIGDVVLIKSVKDLEPASR